MDTITIHGAREHNLKDLHLTIPRNQLVVLTGPSGSGKSSLAFDTIYAEGQRRYVESLSAYARQFLEQMPKPDVDAIFGLSPAISIDQKLASHNPRSTVGTVTGIYDYLRVLYARIGHPHCPRCRRAITAQAVHQMADAVLTLPRGTRLEVLAPIVRDRKGEYRKELDQLRRQGFTHARIDGKPCDLADEIRLKKQYRHTIEVVVDRLIAGPAIRPRVTEALRTALKLAAGVAVIEYNGTRRLFSERLSCPMCGTALPELTHRIFSFNSSLGACPACHGLGVRVSDESEENGAGPVCQVCGGARLRPESLAITIGGQSIAEACRLPINQAEAFLATLSLTDRETFIASRLLKEIRERLAFLNTVGLDYLTLDRPAATLAGGEAQRVRLATQIGSELVGVLYILDEPSIGLHARDHRRLLEALCRIRDQGNSVLVVEHDEETIRTADWVIDLGPGAGTRGGWIVAQGSPQAIMAEQASLTGQYLRGALTVALPPRIRPPHGFLTIHRAHEHNLRDITVQIPLGLLTVITGVSGSGKSTLLLDVLYRSLTAPGPPQAENRRSVGCDTIEGAEAIDKVLHVDQSPIGRTPRSNPSTYIGLFTHIRALFAQLSDSKIRGYSAGRYSFNVRGGRCEACHGGGLVRVAMHFLPDVFVTCETCKGKRYNRETLAVTYKGRHIAEILAMTVDEAVSLFEPLPAIRVKLETLRAVGLGYITLGQQATSLSGGEAQRIKLSRELGKRPTGRTLYILDEPTTGLHFSDIQRLLEILNRLVEGGNTVIVIEHQPDVIRNADWLIDLGPEGGEGGGEVVAVGPPSKVACSARSYTGQMLKRRGVSAAL